LGSLRTQSRETTLRVKTFLQETGGGVKPPTKPGIWKLHCGEHTTSVGKSQCDPQNRKETPPRTVHESQIHQGPGMRYYALIPARYASSRFPGKPLTPILGQPMFGRVVHRARQCPLFSGVYVATDDERIAAEAERRDIPCVLTHADHDSGTDRVLEAADTLGLEEDAVVANIQGDEPTLLPSMLTRLMEPFSDTAVQVTTLARRISAQDAQNPDLVKVVLSQWGRALYFSRSPVPYGRDPDEASYWGHLGLYAYRMRVLRLFAQMQPSPLERTEKLEQLRLLEAEIPIHAVATEDHAGQGVDSPQDVPLVEKIIQEQERCGLS